MMIESNLSISGNGYEATGLDQSFRNTSPLDDPTLTSTDKLALGNADDNLMASGIGPDQTRVEGVGAAVTVFSNGVNLLNNLSNTIRANNDLAAASPQIRELLDDARANGPANGVLVEMTTETIVHPGPIKQVLYHDMRVLGEGASPREVLNSHQSLEYIPENYDRQYLWVKPDENSNSGSIDGSDTSHNSIGRTEVRLESELPR